MAVLYLLPNLLTDTPAEKDLLPAKEEKIVTQLEYLIAEDEKRARQFLRLFSFPEGKTFREIPIGVLNEHTSLPEKQALVQEVKKRGCSGLISDCGMPCLADPGSDLVLLAKGQGITVKGLAGPSSLVLGLALSGLGGQRFTFHGYLPREERELLFELKKIEGVSKKELSTHLWIETPYRNLRMWESIKKALSPTSFLSIACNLTAPNEWVETRLMKDWLTSPLPPIEKKEALFLMRASL